MGGYSSLHAPPFNITVAYLIFPLDPLTWHFTIGATKAISAGAGITSLQISTLSTILTYSRILTFIHSCINTYYYANANNDNKKYYSLATLYYYVMFLNNTVDLDCVVCTA